MHEAIILDTETTHTEDPEVIELSWRTAHLDSARPADGGSTVRFMPKKEISWGALATHHILPGDLQGCLPSSVAPSHVPPAIFWIGHNVDFDWKALGSPAIRRICTLAMARAIWPKCDSHKLTALTYFLEGALPETRGKVLGAHGAAVDVGLCAGILARIIDDEGIATFPDLHGFSEECRIPKIMTFGKFKGEPISAVDRGWSNWYVRQTNPPPDPYLLTALRRAKKL